MGRDAADSSTRLGSDVEPDGGLRRLQWAHINKDERYKLAYREARKLPTRQRKDAKKMDQTEHLSVYIHLCETRAAERSARSESAKGAEGNVEWKDAKKKERGRGQTFEV